MDSNEETFLFLFSLCVLDQSVWMGFGLDILNAWLIVMLSYNTLPIKIHFDLIFKLSSIETEYLNLQGA